MKKKDYFIILLGIVVITLVFYGFREFEYTLVLVILGILVILFVIFFFLMLREKMKLNNYKIYNTYNTNVFSCCYINDDVDFSKIFKIITKKVSKDSFKMKADEFIKYMEDKNLLIKLNGSEEFEYISEKINFLLEKYDVDLKIEYSDIKKSDKYFTDIRRNSRFSVFICNLNVITKRIRETGYELVQIYPASMYKKKEKYYFVLVPTGRLLDLGEIGFLG